jgi:hypothetical protein
MLCACEAKALTGGYTTRKREDNVACLCGAVNGGAEKEKDLHAFSILIH